MGDSTMTQVIPCLSCWAGNHQRCERPDDIDNDAEDPEGHRYSLVACCCGESTDDADLLAYLATLDR